MVAEVVLVKHERDGRDGEGVDGGGGGGMRGASCHLGVMRYSGVLPRV